MNWMTRHFHSRILRVSFRAAKLLSYALVGRDNFSRIGARHNVPFEVLLGSPETRRKRRTRLRPLARVRQFKFCEIKAPGKQAIWTSRRDFDWEISIGEHVYKDVINLPSMSGPPAMRSVILASLSGELVSTLGRRVNLARRCRSNSRRSRVRGGNHGVAADRGPLTGVARRGQRTAPLSSRWLTSYKSRCTASTSKVGPASMIRSFSLETARVAPRCDLAVTFGKLRHDRH